MRFYTSSTKYYFITLFAIGISLVGCADEKTKACRTASDTYVKALLKEKPGYYDLIEWTSFYSPKYDTCIHSEVKRIGNSFEAKDLSGTLQEHSGPHGLTDAYVVICNNTWSHSVLNQSSPHQSNSISYDHWIQGGKKTPEELSSILYEEWVQRGSVGLPPYARQGAGPNTLEECEHFFSKWIEELHRSS